MRSRSPQIAAIGADTSAASSSRPVANEAPSAGVIARACRAPTHYLPHEGGIDRGGVVDEQAEAGAPQWRDGQEPALPWPGRALEQGVRGHGPQHAVLPRRRRQPARAHQHEPGDGVRMAQREARRDRPAQRVAAHDRRCAAERAQRRGQVVARGVEREAAGRRVRPAEAGQVERDAARAPGQELHRARPVLPGAAEPVQQQDGRSGARLGTGDHAALDALAQLAERHPVRQRGGPRGCGRRSGSGSRTKEGCHGRTGLVGPCAGRPGGRRFISVAPAE